MSKARAFLIAILLAAAGAAAAQSLEGTWTEPQYNAVMTLASNGAYVFQHPGGSSRGRYGLNGRLLWMQDAATSQTIWYNIASLTVDALTLQDSKGLFLRFQRKPAASAPPPQPVSPAPKSGPEGAVKILSRKDGRVLTWSHVETGAGLIQVIIGQAVTPAEIKEIEAQSILEFNQNPSGFLAEMDRLAGSLAAIRAQTDPVKIGLVRQQLFAALHTATAAMKESDKPLLVRICNRYIRVLAADPAQGLVLTDRDAEGMLNYTAFQSGLEGRAVELGPELKAALTADLVRSFPGMSLEQKRLLCTASLIWLLLDANWKRLTPAQQQQFRAAHLQQAQAAAPPAVSGNVTPSPKSPREAMRDYQARQNMFRIMNRMNTNTHALSLNIIENMGGTRNYWKAADY